MNWIQLTEDNVNYVYSLLENNIPVMFSHMGENGEVWYGDKHRLYLSLGTIICKSENYYYMEIPQLSGVKYNP